MASHYPAHRVNGNNMRHILLIMYREQTFNVIRTMIPWMHFKEQFCVSSEQLKLLAEIVANLL